MAHRSIVPTFYRLMGAYLGMGLLWGGVLGLSTSHLAHGASGHLALKHKKKSKTPQGAGGVQGAEQGAAEPGPGGMALWAKQAFLMDMKTGAVLFDRRADDRVPPSSMSKIMTAFLAFEDLKAGRLSLNQTFDVSEKAWRMGGSKMFVPLHHQVSVEDLLRGIIIQSGNDASVVLAEGMAGSEDVFAQRMTQKAHDLGAVNTTFKNATGWPHDDHLSTARDLALIAAKTISLFPEYYYLYGEKDFTYNKIQQQNRNPLLGKMGCDGLKTGSTDAGGFGVVASCVQDGRRLLMVINGTPSKKTRAADARNLMGWGFSNWVSPTLYRKGQQVALADVWLGTAGTVPLVLDHDLAVTLPRASAHHMKVEVSFDGPIPAPITMGQTCGNLIVTLPDGGVQTYTLKTGSSVEKIGFFKRISAALHYLFWGHN